MSDEWDFYLTRVEGHPASIFVDLGLRPEAPLADHPAMTCLRLSMRQPRDDGLSSREEYPRLCEIEDAVTQSASEADPKISYVGRNTCNGCRDFYCYSTSVHHAESRLGAALAAFPEYEYEFHSKDDPNWSSYFKFLLPTERDYQMICNRNVLEALKKEGDRHEIERDVRHFVYFNAADQRVWFIERAAQLSYAVVSEWEDVESKWPFGLIVNRVHAVGHEIIDAVVLELFDLTKECRGNYDGWETIVMTEPE